VSASVTMTSVARSGKQRAKDAAHAAVRPVVRLLLRLRVAPDVMSLAGLLLSLLSGLMFMGGHFRTAALWGLAAAACDLLDGELARASGQTTPFGAFLDSTLDRVAEGALLGGIAAFYITHLVALNEDPALRIEEAARGLLPITWALAALIAGVALVGSFLVSYTRARAEGLGIDCRVGWFERPERLVLVLGAALFGVGRVMMAALLLLCVLSWWTAAQRVIHVWRHSGTPGEER
jgi:phosphatidylinositol phosphate synthase